MRFWNKFHHCLLQSILPLARMQESLVLDSRFRGNDATRGGVLYPERNKNENVSNRSP